jgi:3-hydroxyacyl-CoA dehydrogenase/enoyl-CoA hydratase/3-hydroxybutyryl-CoA epimerase
MTSTPSAPPSPARLLVRDRLAILELDDPGRPVNTVSTRLMQWLEDQLPTLEAGDFAGLVVRSAKRDHFMAGADIAEMQALADAAEVRALLERGHEIVRRFTALRFPTVAAIHGACLGGGLEVALACDWRVASDHAKTRLGLPEVQLGLIPGLGGTQRLPRLIGVADALDLVLTGKQLDGRRARRLGLVDEVCHPAILEQAAEKLLASGKRRSVPTQPLGKRATNFLAGVPLAKDLVYDRARESVLAKTGGHYPAPLRAIEVVREGMRHPLGRALEIETRAFADLVVTPTAKNLIALFFAKTDADGRASRLGATATLPPRVAVLGAGFMGSGIAQVLAEKGVPVVMKDRDLPSVGRGMAHCARRFDEIARRRRWRPAEVRAAMGRVLPTTDYELLRGARLVVEAVYEELEVKHRVLAEVEQVAAPDMVFASNTSTIPIAEIARGARHPENVVGMHFFSPVHKMPLLEVIRHPQTSERALAQTVELGRRMGKTIVVVGDGPGFFTSRVLGPFLNEAVWCLAQGATVEQIDQAVTSWGWPVGPLALLDEVGIDIAVHAGQVVIGHLGDRLHPPPTYQRMLTDGRFGRKAGKGFYRYGDRGKEVDPEVYRLLDWQPGVLPNEEIAERCWLQMLNETARTISDGVIENPGDIDLAVIFGFGFPPFRGGILREADRLGLATVVARLEEYAARYGERLAPAPLLHDMARRGARFHRR